MINCIKGNTISEADTKKKINKLNEIKKVETNSKRLIESQKKITKFVWWYKTIFNVSENESENENENVSENENVNDNENVREHENENENVSENENENENVSENENENESENVSENENENENENKSDDGQYYLEQINNNFKQIDETKSIEDQINIF